MQKAKTEVKNQKANLKVRNSLISHWSELWLLLTASGYLLDHTASLKKIALLYRKKGEDTVR